MKTIPKLIVPLGLIIVLAVASIAVPSLADAGKAETDSIPAVTNVTARQRSGTFLVDISYDVEYTGGSFVDVFVFLSTDDGVTFPVPCPSVTGDVGTQLAIGTDRSIVWDALADFPDFASDDCRVRVFAGTEFAPPSLSFWRSDIDGSNQMAITGLDTIGFGAPFRLGWYGQAPMIEGLDPAIIAQYDTIPPVDDGLSGFKYRFPAADCDPDLEDCWYPKYFDEGSGDSISFFAPIDEIAIANDGSNGVLHPSGPFEIMVNAQDLAGGEVPPSGQLLTLIINYDPETVILDRQTDWAHPEDPEIYPYYILLEDPTQTHHPFGAGDRIPDRTYVVFKGLARDDPRDMIVDPGAFRGVQGAFDGLMTARQGFHYTIFSTYSELGDGPTWGPDANGWCADTTGFMPAPRTEYTFLMRGVDEHGRRDGTPASLSFSVGEPPCVQGIELLENSVTPSAFGPELPCYDGSGPHPSFGDTTLFYVQTPGSSQLPGRDYLENRGQTVLAVDMVNGFVEFPDDTSGMSATHYLIPAYLYGMDLLLHGRDDESESWPNIVMRTGGWQYQVDYACDPDNQIQDGPGSDDLDHPFWGLEEPDDEGLVIALDGVWRLTIDVAAPQILTLAGPDYFRQYLMAVFGVDLERADWILEMTTRQFSLGRVSAIALDQTSCGYWPTRPAMYHYFFGTRPPSATPPPSMTWRDSEFDAVDGVMGSAPLDRAAMESNDGVELERHFRIILVDNSGAEYQCD